MKFPRMPRAHPKQVLICFCSQPKTFKHSSTRWSRLNKLAVRICCKTYEESEESCFFSQNVFTETKKGLKSGGWRWLWCERCERKRQENTKRSFREFQLSSTLQSLCISFMTSLLEGITFKKLPASQSKFGGILFKKTSQEASSYIPKMLVHSF